MTHITTQPSLTTLAGGYPLIHQQIDDRYEIQVRIFVHAGCIDDTPQHRGIAHFVEHLILARMLGPRGTTMAKDYADPEYAFAGVQGVTSDEITKYMCRFSGDNKEQRARQFIEDFLWIIHKSFPDEDTIKTERRRIQHEAALRNDNVYDYLYDIRTSLLYWGDMIPTIGSADTLQSIGPDEIRAFLETYYTPDNIVIVVVGNSIEAEKICVSGARAPTAARVFPQSRAEAGEFLIEDRPRHASYFVYSYKAPESEPEGYYFSLLMKQIQSEKIFRNNPKFDTLYMLPYHYFHDSVRETWIDFYGTCLDKRWHDVRASIVESFKKKAQSLDEMAFMTLKEDTLFFRKDYVSFEELADFIGAWYFRTGKVLHYDDFADDIKKISLSRFKAWIAALLARPHLSIEL